MHVTRRQTCRACGSRSLTPAISLGEQHLQGSFIKEGIETPLRKVPMELVRCNPQLDENACGLLQAAYTVPPAMMYHQYWYKSGTNRTMRDHLADVAKDAVDTLGYLPSAVLDIGCNDGTLLRAFNALSNALCELRLSTMSLELWGVDPSNVASAAQRGLCVINAFFPSRTADSELGARSFDLVCAIAMFYDLEDPVGFVKAVRRRLTDNGVFCFEMSHLPAMLKQNSYDTLCHEHIEYYSFAALETILRLGGMRVHSVSENAINGGSIRVMAVPEVSTFRTDASVVAMRIREFDLTLDTNAPYEAFQKRADLHRNDLRALLQKIKAEGKTVHVYGASTKGNTLLQWCSIDERLVVCAADRNPDKTGARTPGTEIPIVSEETSRAMKPDYYLVLPWHFREEFVEREQATLAAGTKFIFPLPTITVVGAE